MLMRLIAFAVLLVGCKTTENKAVPKDSSQQAHELTSFTCDLTTTSSSGELKLTKMRLSVRKPDVGQPIDLTDVELEGVLKGSPVKFLRYCNNSYVIENPGTFVGSWVQVDLNYNKNIHWEMMNSGIPRYNEIGVSFAINSNGKLSPLQDGSLARVAGYKVNCKEGLDSTIPLKQCVSGYLPKQGPRWCATDSSVSDSEYAKMCTSLGGNVIGCFGGLNSMCDINVRQKIISSGKFQGFDEKGAPVKCDNYETSGGASICGGSEYAKICESEGFIAFPNCNKRCGVLCSSKLSAVFE